MRVTKVAKNQQNGVFGEKGLGIKLERWTFRYVEWALSLLVDDPDSMIGGLRCFSGLECLSRARGFALNLSDIGLFAGTYNSPLTKSLSAFGVRASTIPQGSA